MNYRVVAIIWDLIYLLWGSLTSIKERQNHKHKNNKHRTETHLNQRQKLKQSNAASQQKRGKKIAKAQRFSLFHFILSFIYISYFILFFYSNCPKRNKTTTNNNKKRSIPLRLKPRDTWSWMNEWSLLLVSSSNVTYGRCCGRGWIVGGIC